jgi:hypothetical protein
VRRNSELHPNFRAILRAVKFAFARCRRTVKTPSGTPLWGAQKIPYRTLRESNCHFDSPLSSRIEEFVRSQLRKKIQLRCHPPNPRLDLMLRSLHDLRGHPAREGCFKNWRGGCRDLLPTGAPPREEPLPSYGNSARGRPRSRLAGGLGLAHSRLGSGRLSSLDLSKSAAALTGFAS